MKFDSNKANRGRTADKREESPQQVCDNSYNSVNTQPAPKLGYYERSSYERFAIPYTFKPQLSVAEAFVAACGAFLRILFGSMIFAVWGAYILLAWTTIHNLFLRCAVVAILVATLGGAMALLMLGISRAVKWIWPKTKIPPAASH